MANHTFDGVTYGVLVNDTLAYSLPTQGQCFYLTTTQHVYVDSASPLGVLPLLSTNTAYTVGQKVAARHLTANEGLPTVGYLECVTAGTTGTNLSGSAVSAGERMTFGTAVFALRMFHGWARAFAGGLRSGGYSVTSYLVGSPTIYPAISPVFLVASTSSFALDGSSSPAAYLRCDDTLLKGTAVRVNHVSPIAISVSKTGNVPTAFLKGATWSKSIGNGNTGWVNDNPYGCFGSISHPNSVLRGLVATSTVGSAEGSASDTAHNLFQTKLSSQVYYDCSFNSAAASGLFPGTIFPMLTGQRHATRVLVNNTAPNGYPAMPLTGGWTIPSGAVGGIGDTSSATGSATVLDACTFSRTQTASTVPIFSHTQFKADQITSPSISQDSVHIFGGDTSSMSSPLTGILRGEWVDPVPQQKITPLTIYGVKANASSLPTVVDETQPSSWATFLGASPHTEIVSLEESISYGVVDKTMLRSNTIYRTGGGTDGLGVFSLVCKLVKDVPFYQYDYYFLNTKTDGSYRITHEFLFSNTAGSGLTGLVFDDLQVNVAYPDSPSNDGMDWRSSCPNPLLGLNPTLVSPAPTASTVAWTGTVTGPIKYKASVIVNPRRLGPVYVQITVRLTPRTLFLMNDVTLPVYVDPVPVISAT